MKHLHWIKTTTTTMKSKSLVENKGKKVTVIGKTSPTFIYLVHRVGWRPWGTPCYHCHKWRWQCLVWKTMDLFSILSCIWIPFHLRAAKIPSTILLGLNTNYSVRLYTQQILPNKSRLHVKENFPCLPLPDNTYVTAYMPTLYTLSQLPGNLFHPPVFRYNSSEMPLRPGPYIWGSSANPGISVLPSTLH